MSLTAPQNGASLTVGDKVLLSADASGPQGVVGVEFYVDGVRVAVAYAAPYVAVWTATPGAHILHAIAYSPHNTSARSDFVNITVGTGGPPTPDPNLDFSILAPADNSTLPNKTDCHSGGDPAHLAYHLGQLLCRRRAAGYHRHRAFPVVVDAHAGPPHPPRRRLPAQRHRTGPRPDGGIRQPVGGKISIFPCPICIKLMNAYAK